MVLPSSIQGPGHSFVVKPARDDYLRQEPKPRMGLRVVAMVDYLEGIGQMGSARSFARVGIAMPMLLPYRQHCVGHLSSTIRRFGTLVGSFDMMRYEWVRSKRSDVCRWD